MKGGISKYQSMPIPTAPPGTRPDEVTPIEEVPEISKKALKALHKAVIVLSTVRETEFVNDERVLELRKITVLRNKHGFYTDEGGKKLLAQAEYVETSFEQWKVNEVKRAKAEEERLLKSGPFTQALRDAEKSVTHRPHGRGSNPTGDVSNGFTDEHERVEGTGQQGPRASESNKVLAHKLGWDKWGKEVNDYGPTAEKTARGKVVAGAGRDKNKLKGKAKKASPSES